MGFFDPGETEFDKNCEKIRHHFSVYKGIMNDLRQSIERHRQKYPGQKFLVPPELKALLLKISELQTLRQKDFNDVESLNWYKKEELLGHLRKYKYQLDGLPAKGVGVPYFDRPLEREREFLEWAIISLEEILRGAGVRIEPTDFTKKSSPVEGETPFEREIKNIEKIIETEIGALVASEQLKVKYPQHKDYIDKRFRRLIDSLRDS